IRTYIGNTKIFSDTIHNFTTNPYRRVDLKAQLAHSVDVHDAIAKLRERLPKIAHVEKDPAPSVDLLEFTPMGPALAVPPSVPTVRPFVHNDHYWDVYFATNEAIVEVCSKAGYAVPEQHFHIRKAG